MKRAWMVAAGLVMLVASGCDEGTPTGVPTPTEPPNQPPPPAIGPVTTVELNVDTLRLEEGATLQLTATPRDANGQVVPGRAVVWTSADPGVVHVDALGATTGIRTGTATVSARVDGVTTAIPALISSNYAYDLVFSAWDGADTGTTRIFRTDLSDTTRSVVRIGPDAPSSGGIPSPDGTKLAWLADLGGGVRAIMVANANGSAAVEIVRSTDLQCGRISWSPDGSRIAFTCAIGDTDRDIWVADVAGSELHNITEGIEGHQEWPSWSPVLPGGGSRIAYAQYEAGVPGIWTIGEDGADPARVTSGFDDQPAWSPDGSSIAFRRMGAAIFSDLMVASATGGDERVLVGLPGRQEEPAWSPDGRLVAFASNHPSYGTGEALVRNVYTVWADGSKLAERTGPTLHTMHPAWRVR